MDKEHVIDIREEPQEDEEAAIDVNVEESVELEDIVDGEDQSNVYSENNSESEVTSYEGEEFPYRRRRSLASESLRRILLGRGTRDLRSRSDGMNGGRSDSDSSDTDGSDSDNSGDSNDSGQLDSITVAQVLELLEEYDYSDYLEEYGISGSDTVESVDVNNFKVVIYKLFVEEGIGSDSDSTSSGTDSRLQREAAYDVDEVIEPLSVSTVRRSGNRDLNTVDLDNLLYDLGLKTVRVNVRSADNPNSATQQTMDDDNDDGSLINAEVLTGDTPVTQLRKKRSDISVSVRR